MEIPCRICCMPYDQTTYAPRVLGNCGHTLCTSCIDHSIKVLRETFPNFKHLMLKCPFDNKEHLINDQTTSENFPKNFELIELINEGYRRKSSANITIPNEPEKKGAQSNQNKTTERLKSHSSLTDLTSPVKEWNARQVQQQTVPNSLPNNYFSNEHATSNPPFPPQFETRTFSSGRETVPQRMQSYTVSRDAFTNPKNSRPSAQGFESNSYLQFNSQHPEKLEEKLQINPDSVRGLNSFQQNSKNLAFISRTSEPFITPSAITQSLRQNESQRLTVPAYLPSHLQANSGLQVTYSETSKVNPNNLQYIYPAPDFMSISGGNQTNSSKIIPSPSLNNTGLKLSGRNTEFITPSSHTSDKTFPSFDHFAPKTPLPLATGISTDAFATQNRLISRDNFLKQTTGHDFRESVPEVSFIPALQRYKSENPYGRQQLVPNNQPSNQLINVSHPNQNEMLARNSSEAFFKTNFQQPELLARMTVGSLDNSAKRNQDVSSRVINRADSNSQPFYSERHLNNEILSQKPIGLSSVLNSKLNHTEKPLEIMRFFSSNVDDKRSPYVPQNSSNTPAPDYSHFFAEQSIKPQDVDFARALGDHGKV